MLNRLSLGGMKRFLAEGGMGGESGGRGSGME